MEENSEIRNPLGIEPISKLLRKFAIPSIVAMLVSSFYNIVDQFFIGRTVGTLGNASAHKYRREARKKSTASAPSLC